MERMTIIFLVFIVFYLVFSFIKNRRDENKKNKIKKKLLDSRGVGEKNNLLLPVIFAAIAASMENTPYVIKRVFLKGDVDEKISSWKIAGRSECMMKKNTIR